VVLDNIKENDFHGAFEGWEKRMGWLYTFPRRLFWRRWQPKLNKLSHHFFFDLVRELSDTPRTYALRRQQTLIRIYISMKLARQILEPSACLPPVDFNRIEPQNKMTVVRH
jgi:hypothetical protein